MQKGFPVDLSSLDNYELSEIELCFIDSKSSEGEVLLCSIEKRGSSGFFIYTWKQVVRINGQRLTRKRGLSEKEYRRYKSFCIRPDTHVLQM